MKSIITVFLLIGAFCNAYAYNTPQSFMDLYFDFTGANNKGFPANQKTIAQLLLEAEETTNSIANEKGPLVLILN